jgi:predicted flap endonuclease-1-like 5' DNA nuclease
MRKRLRALAPVVVVLAVGVWWWLRRSKEQAARPIEIRGVGVEPPPLDELRRIEGIGPKIAALLQDQGIRTFALLAGTERGRLRQILREAGLPFVDPETWPEQAALAAQGKWEELEALQGELKRGRRA